jgi:2-alkenal reductase
LRRQIAFTSVIGLLLLTLVMGLTGGVVMGGVVGYWYGHQHEPSASTSALRSSSDLVPASSGQSDVSSQSRDLIVSKVNPAVVTIENQQPGNDGTEQTVSMGSGFIIDQQGHVVTNNHVVDGADALVVLLLDGTKETATLVGTDSFQDVAVVKIDGKVPATVAFGDSNTVQAGQSVIAIGSALGEFRNTVTDGIVGGVQRSLDTGDGYLLGNLIQHDAPINPGNSGGPLLNLSGQVIGMNTAVVRGGFGQPGAEGLGFAIASDTVKSYAEQLIVNGRIDHPYVGVSFRPTNQESGAVASSDPQPVTVADVDPGGPADKAGIAVGDIITAVDGTTLDGEHEFLNEVYRHKPGEVVTLSIQPQNGRQADIQVTLGSRPAGSS